MICDNCGKNNANTHIHSVVNGVVTEKNLCSECAAAEGYGNNSLMGLFASMLSPGSLPELGQEDVCEKCGTSFAEISKTGKLGCAECYKKYKDRLLPYLKRVHGSVKHIGKRAENENIVLVKEDKIALMRRKLSELVRNEEYEQAAVIRDEIKKAEEENGNE